MFQENHNFPIDVTRIQNLDLFDKFFSLPKKPEELYKLRDDLFDAFFSVVASCKNDEIRRILLIRAKLPLEYVRVFSIIRFRAHSKNIGLRLDCSQKSTIPDPYNIPSSPFGKGEFIERIKIIPRKRVTAIRIRNLIYNMKVNENPFYYFTSFENGRRIANISPSALDMLYLRRLGKSFFFLNEAELGYMGADWSKVCPIHEYELNDITDTIFTAMLKVGQKHMITPSTEEEVLLRDRTYTHISSAAEDFYNVNRAFKNIIGQCTLMCGTNCNYFNRILASANRDLGGEVFAFAHGNEVGRIRDMRIETSLTDVFVTYNKQAVIDINSCMNKFTHPEPVLPKVLSADDNRLLDFWRKQLHKPKPKKIKTIMIIGFPFDVNMNMDKTFPDTYYLDMEVKLAKPLLDEGFKVLYKIHPESLAIPCLNEFLSMLSSNLGPNFKVVFERFENVVDMADAFLFPFTSTTTFNWALCTNKKVVVIDFDEFVRPFSEDARGMIAIRCTIIPHEFDENKRLLFDRDVLVNSFKSPISDFDIGFQQKYIFP